MFFGASLMALVGENNTGKSYSQRNLDGSKTILISPNTKIPFLPPPGGKPGDNPKFFNFTWNDKSFMDIIKKKGIKNPTSLLPKLSELFKENNVSISELTGNILPVKRMRDIPVALNFIDEFLPEVNTIIIGDFLHSMTEETTDSTFRSRSTGNEAWSRWADLGSDILDSIIKSKDELRSDLLIIIEFHQTTKQDGDELKTKIKFPGSMLDKEIKADSYFDNIIYTKRIGSRENKDGELVNDFGFVTKAKVFDEITYDARSRVDLPTIMPNDLKPVIEKIKSNQIQ